MSNILSTAAQQGHTALYSIFCTLPVGEKACKTHTLLRQILEGVCTAVNTLFIRLVYMLRQLYIVFQLLKFAALEEEEKIRERERVLNMSLREHIYYCLH